MQSNRHWIQNKMEKNYLLSPEEIEPLIEALGACFASDMITVQGKPVHFMYRDNPDFDGDSGWRFMSGYENESYMLDENNIGLYDVNTIANYDPSIIPYLGADFGETFEKAEGTFDFEPVYDEDSENKEDLVS